MKKCKHCQEEIENSVKVCPKCGQKQGMPTWAKVLIIVGVVLLLLGGCAIGSIGIIGVSMYNSSKKLTQKTESIVEEITEEVTTNETTEKMSEEEALELGNTLWKYADEAYFGGENVWPSHFEGNNLVCDTTLEKVKEKFASDFKYDFYSDTEKTESGTLDNFFVETNSTTCGGVARGTIQTYLETELSNPVITEDEITYTATSKYCSNAFCENGKEVDHTIVSSFKIKKINDEWYIAFYAVTR